MIDRLDRVLDDFQRIPCLVQAHEWCQITKDSSADCHRRPRPLRDGERAVYAFFKGRTWLRIGQTGYSQRFTSHHYGTKRAKSTFAKDIWNNRGEFGFCGREEDIGDWFFTNIGRANIIMPSHWPNTVSLLLEAYLHYCLNPRFEGRR